MPDYLNKAAFERVRKMLDEMPLPQEPLASRFKAAGFETFTEPEARARRREAWANMYRGLPPDHGRFRCDGTYQVPIKQLPEKFMGMVEEVPLEEWHRSSSGSVIPAPK